MLRAWTAVLAAAVSLALAAPVAAQGYPGRYAPTCTKAAPSGGTGTFVLASLDDPGQVAVVGGTLADGTPFGPFQVAYRDKKLEYTVNFRDGSPRLTHKITVEANRLVVDTHVWWNSSGSNSAIASCNMATALAGQPVRTADTR